MMWVTENGGKVVPDQNRKTVHFIVERHGVVSSLTHASLTSYITPHWIYSCKEVLILHLHLEKVTCLLGIKMQSFW